MSARLCVTGSPCRSERTGWDARPMSDVDRFEDGYAEDELEHGAAAIIDIVNRLEDLVGMGKRVPFSSRVVVEASEFLGLVDLLRTTVPQEIQLARRVIKEREKIIGDAHSEAARILKTARDRAEMTVSDEGILLEVRQQSEEILRQTDERRQRSMGMVDVYALNQFEKVEEAMRDCLRLIDGAFRDAIDSLEQARASVTERQR